MRFTLFTFLTFIAFFSLTASAQDAMLTKEETVNYIQKKLIEVEGRELVDREGRVLRSKVAKGLISVKGSVVHLAFTHTFGTEKHEFNPAYISEVSLIKPKSGEGVGTVFVMFVGKVVKSTSYNGKVTDDFYVLIPYFAIIPQNGERMMKALLHLKDLAKAEEDPFGN